MSSAANHRKRSHRSESIRGNRRRSMIITAPAVEPRKSFVTRFREYIRRVIANNAAKARPDAPAE